MSSRLPLVLPCVMGLSPFQTKRWQDTCLPEGQRKRLPVWNTSCRPFDSFVMLEFMNVKNISLFLLTLALSGAALSTRAEVTLHPLFADNAVLQQNMKVPIW